MLRLYGDHYSGNCYKARLALVQLGIPHQWIDVDVLKKETRSADFLAMNPAGKIPLLEIEPGRYLPESNAILHYLADGTPLIPTDREQHARVLAWMFWEQYIHEPAVASARFIVRYLKRPPEREQALVDRIAESHEALRLMEDHLATHRFLVGDHYSIADIALYAYTHVAEEGNVSLDSYPKVRAWLERVRGQPGYVPMGP